MRSFKTGFVRGALRRDRLLVPIPFGLVIVVTLLATLATGLHAQQPLNFGFERPSVEGFARPWGWSLVSLSEGAEIMLDTAVRRSGRRSLRITRAAEDADAEEGWAGHALTHWVAPRFAWGRRTRVFGWLRAEELAGSGRLMLEAWGDGVLAADTASLSGATDGDWHRLELEIDVDSTAHSVVVTAALRGTGSVWFDDLALEADGRTWDAVPVAATPSAEEIEWLASRTTAFATVDHGPCFSRGQPGAVDCADFEDLGEFARIVGDARVVSLGEATHGTSEFFRTKHRLLAFLVEEAGFRTFAIEANQLAVEPINAYVRGAPGDAQSLMRALFRVWNTEEMRDLIEWMRTRNAANPDQMVEFIGFDMQDPRLPIDSVAAFLGRVDPVLRHEADRLYGPYRDAWRRADYPQATDSVRQTWFDDAQWVYERIREHRHRWLSTARTADDSTAIDWVVQNANVVRQAALTALRIDFAVRDSAMAANIAWSLERRPGTRMVVWAHDGHISRREHAWANYWGGGSMGGHLAERLGANYRAFGLLTHSGAYSGALGAEIIDAELFPAPVGSVEEALHRISDRIGSPFLITDLRGASEVADGAWVVEPRLIRMIGYAAEDWGFASLISVGSQFDGIVFVDRTTPSRVISTAH